MVDLIESRLRLRQQHQSADVGPIKASGLFAWLLWIFLHIFWLIGFRNRIAVMTEWAWAYVTLQRRVRIMTGGGGGLGAPSERDPNAVRRDVSEGYVSAEAARRDYGLTTNGH